MIDINRSMQPEPGRSGSWMKKARALIARWVSWWQCRWGSGQPAQARPASRSSCQAE